MPNAPDCDLHPYFRNPDKARAILDACIADNVAKGTDAVRIVHGKGTGNFRDLIHKHLGKHPDVDGFTLCDPLHGGSGATWVHLKTKRKIPGEPGKPLEESRGNSTLWRLALYSVVVLSIYALHLGLAAIGIAVVIFAAIELWAFKENPN
jgi:hypothetical protein